MKRLTLCLAMLLPISVAPSGCSWIFVKPLPPDYRPGDPVDCTTSQVAHGFDALFAMSSVGVAAFEAGQDGFKSIGAPVFVAFVAGSLWLSSAIYGYRKTSACLKAKQEDDQPRGLSAQPATSVTPAAPQADPY